MRLPDTNRNSKKSALAVLTVIVCGACSTQTAEKTGTLPMTAQTADFVQAYKVKQQANTTDGSIPLQMSARIGASDDPDVCETGELYGPFTVTNGTVTENQTATATPPTLRLANNGNLAVCMIVTSPVDATVDISANSLAMSTRECTESPADVSGDWQGNFSCTSSCGNQSGSVSLTIEQDNYSATYSDDEASYEGTVCGNVFKYSGSGPGYTENGTFVLNSDGTASKTSHYVTTDGLCSGDCTDPVLVR